MVIKAQRSVKNLWLAVPPPVELGRKISTFIFWPICLFPSLYFSTLSPPHVMFAEPYTSFCLTLTCSLCLYFVFFVPPSGSQNTIDCKNIRLDVSSPVKLRSLHLSAHLSLVGQVQNCQILWFKFVSLANSAKSGAPIWTILDESLPPYYYGPLSFCGPTNPKYLRHQKAYQTKAQV